MPCFEDEMDILPRVILKIGPTGLILSVDQAVDHLYHRVHFVRVALGYH